MKKLRHTEINTLPKLTQVVCDRQGNQAEAFRVCALNGYAVSKTTIMHVMISKQKKRPLYSQDRISFAEETNNPQILKICFLLILLVHWELSVTM